MKNKIKQEKGVTLTILVITVITLMIITGTLIYNVEDSTRIKKLTNLKNETVEYEIFKIYSIDPDDVSCVESVENNTREITLITCTNGHKNRLVTKAREVL